MGKDIEQDDIFPLTWHSPASQFPPLYAIFVNNKLIAKQMIEESRIFVVNFMPIEQKDKIILAGKYDAEFSDKFAKIGLTTAECRRFTDCKRIKESVAWLECEVTEQHALNDHTLFLGHVVHSEATDKEAKRTFHLEHEEYTTTK